MLCSATATGGRGGSSLAGTATHTNLTPHTHACLLRGNRCVPALLTSCKKETLVPPASDTPRRAGPLISGLKGFPLRQALDMARSPPIRQVPRRPFVGGGAGAGGNPCFVKLRTGSLDATYRSGQACRNMHVIDNQPISLGIIHPLLTPPTGRFLTEPYVLYSAFHANMNRC